MAAEKLKDSEKLSQNSQNKQRSKRSSPLYCLFNAATRMAIVNEAMRKHPTNRKSRNAYRRILERDLGCFYKACGLLGCTGSVPARAFRIMLTQEPWPRCEGEPRFSYRTFRRLMQIFIQGGILREENGSIIFIHWKDSTHFSQEEANKSAKSCHRWQTIPENSSLQGTLGAVPRSEQPSRKKKQRIVLSPGQAAGGKAHPFTRAMPAHPNRLPSGFDAKMDAYDAQIKHEIAATNAWLDQHASDAQAQAPAQAADGTSVVIDAGHETAPKKHVGSNDPSFIEALADIGDSELAGSIGRMRANAPPLSVDDIETSAGNPPTEAASVPSEQPRESNTVGTPAAVAGIGWPDTRQLRKITLRSPSKLETQRARQRRGRDYDHLSVPDAQSVMRVRGAGDWGVVWGKCVRWAASEALLVDAIDATKQEMARKRVRNPAARFIGILRNKARTSMSASFTQAG